MDITYTTKKGNRYTNSKIKRPEFNNHEDQMKYIITCLNEKANSKGNNIRGSKFTIMRSSGNFFDTIDFTIGGSDEDLKSLFGIIF